MTENKKSSGLLTLILGAAAGAALGVLFAPKTGKQTREELGGWLKEKREQGRAKMAELREKLPEQKEKLVSVFRQGREEAASARRHNGTRKEKVEA